MKLADLADLMASCREDATSFEDFRAINLIMLLQWPDDVVEQLLYDHGDNANFLRDYGCIDLFDVKWETETVPIEELVKMPTGQSDGNCMDIYAANPDHWVRVRNQGVHIGVSECWEVHGTWKRSPILIDRRLLGSPDGGLQVVEGRTRVGVLKGRHRKGDHVADRHLAWVGRPSL